MSDSSAETKDGRTGRRPYAVREPEDMRPDERFEEIAAILAAGCLRLRARRDATGGPAVGDQTVAESSQNSLAV